MTGVLAGLHGAVRRCGGARKGADPGSEAGAALALTIFLIMLIGVLSLSIAGAVLAQTSPTQVEQKNTVTLSAAEAGIDVALNRLRAANDGAGAGVLTDLPCTAATGTTLSGSVGPSNGAPQYAVTIRYFGSDPSAESASWRNVNAQGCSGAHPTAVPLYALLESTGSASAVPGHAATVADRTVEATYRFTVTNVNIPGGALPIFDSNAITNWCIAVDHAAVNQAVKVRACSGADTQKWSYTTDLLLQMQDSTGSTYCLSANHAAGSAAVLAACDPLDTKQIWGYDGNKEFEGAAAVNGGLTGSCFYASSLTNGAAVKYGNCQTQIIPDSTVGPGRAGSDMSRADGTCRDAGGNLVTNCTFQIVNYKYFGRCIDMTHQSVTSTWMIGYVCKETPGTSFIAWNQKFFWDPAHAMFCTDNSGATVTGCGTPSGSLYCLYDGTTMANSLPGTRVLLKLCNTADPSQRWGRRFGTGSYSDSWNIYTLREGLCLELSANYPPEASAIDQPWGMIIVNTCDGSTAQKWNAPANLSAASLQNTFEHVP